MPCERWEMVTAEERVKMERDKRIVCVRRGWQSEDVPFVMDGLALVWQRSRRKWTLGRRWVRVIQWFRMPPIHATLANRTVSCGSCMSRQRRDPNML